MQRDPNCIFCKIVAGEIPARKAYEDDEMLAFHDIAPWAPVHVLVIPKAHIASFYDVADSQTPLLGRMFAQAPRLMRELGVDERLSHPGQHRRRRPAGSAALPRSRHGRSPSLGEGLT